VRHATSEDLDLLEPLLERLRKFDALIERRRGVFTRSGRAFLHCHADASGLFVDCRLNADFERFRVSTRKERDAFVARVAASLS
jgi:hypothetical protein